MPRPKSPPSYRLHKARGCAVVTIGGKDRYLGPYGSPESLEAYGRLIAGEGLRAVTEAESPAPVTTEHVTVKRVALKYLDFAVGYYQKHGKPTGEVDNLRDAASSLKKLYGSTPAAAFNPKDLELVRQTMIDDGLSRRTINSRVGRIRRIFRWASVEGLVPAGTYHGLLALDGLKFGRSKARETKPVLPVPAEVVVKTCEHLNDHVEAMVQIQELAGMRPQDIRNLRLCDLDRSSDVWVYTPWTHKTEHHGHTRKIAIGPKAQAVLKPFLNDSTPTTFVFSPRQAVERVRSQRAAARKTKRTPSQLKRTKKPSPKRIPADQYSRTSYERAIGRACIKASVVHWTPNQLRHNCATMVRKKYGLDVASIVLGHRHGSVTEVYAEADFEKAIEVMREVG